MKKIYVLLIGIFLLATTLCIFGQGIAHFLSEKVISIYPVYYLTGLTISGLVLYLAAGLEIFRLFKKRESSIRRFEHFIVLLFIVSLSAAIWSIFVTVMWGAEGIFIVVLGTIISTKTPQS